MRTGSKFFIRKGLNFDIMEVQYEELVEIIDGLYYLYYKKFHQGFISSCFLFESIDKHELECNCLQESLLTNILECFKLFGIINTTFDMSKVIVKCSKGKEKVSTKNTMRLDKLFSINVKFDEFFEKYNFYFLSTEMARQQFFYLFNCTIAFCVKDLTKKIVPKNHASLYRLLLVEENSKCFNLEEDDEDMLKNVLFNEPYSNYNFEEKIKQLDEQGSWVNKHIIKNEVKAILANWCEVMHDVDDSFKKMDTTTDIYKIRNFVKLDVFQYSLPVVK